MLIDYRGVGSRYSFNRSVSTVISVDVLSLLLASSVMLLVVLNSLSIVVVDVVIIVVVVPVVEVTVVVVSLEVVDRSVVGSFLLNKFAICKCRVKNISSKKYLLRIASARCQPTEGSATIKSIP